MKVIFDMKSKNHAKEFLSWLCNSGEQYYWDWMEDGDLSEYTIDEFKIPFDSLDEYNNEDCIVECK